MNLPVPPDALPRSASRTGRFAAGPWLRLCAVGATAAVMLVVASGELGVAHRALAVVALPLLLAVALGAWWAHRGAFVAAAASIVLFLAAMATWWLPPVHITLAALAAAATAVTTARLYRGRRPAPGAWRDYVALTKPRIMSLLLLTGAAGMFVGAKGVPDGQTFAATMVGLALACGGASALNHLLDADLDRAMKRTSSRPVADGRVSPALALEFGLALSALSFVLLGSAVNILTATLALVGNLFYVLVYTRWLKRSTPQNIVIGGAAGAVPPVVGYAAATGNLALPALFLFLIVFVWTPPHFWALALLLKRDYEAARIPMLPVVRGDSETARQVLLYTLLLVGVTLVPFATGTFGVVYLAAAVALGAQFLRLALRLRRSPARPQAAGLFHYSLAYLALLFVAMAIDPMVAL